MYAFLLWNIVLSVFCARLIWDVGELKRKVFDLETEFKWFDKDFTKKIDDIRTNSTIIAKCLEWENNNETATKEESN